MIKWGIGGGLGAIGTAYGLNSIGNRNQSSLTAPPMLPIAGVAAASGFNPVKYLRNFDYGTVTQENGRTVREFRLEAGTATVQLNQSTSFIVWNFNGQVPAPTLRANQAIEFGSSFPIMVGIIIRSISTVPTQRQWMALSQSRTIRYLFTSSMLTRLGFTLTTATLNL
jgi:hypothetical protein